MPPRKPYHRYEIEKTRALNLLPHPHPFQVKVKKWGLIKLVIKEFFHYWGKLRVVLSRPCVYGVFSGPLGGLAPREHLCVGCLRCTTQHPEFVTILRNPARKKLGDEYFSPIHIDTVNYEAETGHVPVKGAGYRGCFGGEGWDGLWTDMSEIVRPTRDGIYGREMISTEIDIGEKLSFLALENQQLHSSYPLTATIPLPLLFDAPPSQILNPTLCSILSESARQLQTLAILPCKWIQKCSLKGAHLIPMLAPNEFELCRTFEEPPLLIEMQEWDAHLFQTIRSVFPQTLVMLRIDFGNDLTEAFHAGVRVFHLIANYHGQCKNGLFVLEAIRQAHLSCLSACHRDEVTLLGSGGIIAAEHLPKAVLCGLDAVALDTSLLVALQARFQGSCKTREESVFQLPPQIMVEWGVQRIKNLTGAWRDQLLEILGAMGLREVRRLRGEIGRGLFQKQLENEAFAGITGYEIP